MGLIKTLILALIIFVGGLIAIAFYARTDAQTYKPIGIEETVNISEIRLFNVINEWRNKNELASFRKDSELCLYAETRLYETSSDYSHRGFELDDLPLRWTYAGENLGKGLKSEEELLHSWLVSPPHAKNIKEDFTHSCIRCEDDRCVQIFGRMK